MKKEICSTFLEMFLNFQREYIVLLSIVFLQSYTLSSDIERVKKKFSTNLQKAGVLRLMAKVIEVRFGSPSGVIKGDPH